MRVDRELLYNAILSVAPGLTAKELTEQSSCVAFRDDRIYTFNEEFFCSAPSPIPGIIGAVVAKPLMELLSRIDKKEIDVSISPDGKIFCIKGVADGSGKIEKQRAELAMEAQVLLPIDSVEKPSDDWKPLDPAFVDAVRLTSSCASTNTKEFLYSCVHIRSNQEDQPGFFEACDRLQIGRWPLSVPLQSADILVRATSLAQIAGLKVVEISETASWLHFRNKEGVALSCRKFMDQYADLGKFIDKTGAHKLTLPKTLDGILARAGIFSQSASVGSFVHVQLRPATTAVMGEAVGSLTIKGEGPLGRYAEQREVVYNGPATEFIIAPQLLSELAKKSEDCWVLPGKLFVDSPAFYYFTCTNSPELLKPAEVKTNADAA